MGWGMKGEEGGVDEVGCKDRGRGKGYGSGGWCKVRESMGG